MKRYVRSSQDIFAMANLNPAKSGLSAQIWSDGQGCTRNRPDSDPTVKIVKGGCKVSVSIESKPRVLAPKGDWRKKFQQSEVSAVEEAIEYVGRNYETFLKHYNDTDGSFDDESLFAELRQKGQYK